MGCHQPPVTVWYHHQCFLEHLSHLLDIMFILAILLHLLYLNLLLICFFPVAELFLARPLEHTGLYLELLNSWVSHGSYYISCRSESSN